MEKLLYLLFEKPEVAGSQLRKNLTEQVVPAIRDAGGTKLVLNVHDEEVAEGTPLFKHDPPMRGMVTFWLESHDTRGPAEEALRAAVPWIAGYLVTESRPLVHTTNPDGRSEGMKQVCCVARKPGLSEHEFYDIWTHDHRIVAVETQSTTGYVRNVIARRLTEDAPDHWTGVVEETFPIGALTDPKVFYDAKDDAALRVNLDRMMASVNRFLDDGPMEFTHMSEYDLG